MRYDFERGTGNELPPALRPFIPNSYALPPRYSRLLNRQILMHSSLLVACQYLYPGDELTVDYRLGPDIPPELIPPWYGHVDLEGARSRLSSAPRPLDPATAAAAGIAVTAATTAGNTAVPPEVLPGNPSPSVSVPAPGSSPPGPGGSGTNKPSSPVKLKVVR